MSCLDKGLGVPVVREDVGNNTSWGINQSLKSVLSRWMTECYCNVRRLREQHKLR